MRFSWVGLLTLAGAGGACRNACQDICVRMADYATECGYTVTDAEIDACIEGQSAPGESRGACREFGDPEVIRTQWSCEDLADYWAPKS